MIESDVSGGLSREVRIMSKSTKFPKIILF